MISSIVASSIYYSFVVLVLLFSTTAVVVVLADTEPCGVDVVATCHPYGSPEGTMCTGYVPPEWTSVDNPPPNYKLNITVNYTLTNTFVTNNITLSYLGVTTNGVNTTFLGGATHYIDELDGVILMPSESFTVETTEELDLNATTKYTSLITAVVLYDGGYTIDGQLIKSICHGHDGFILQTGSPPTTRAIRGLSGEISRRMPALLLDFTDGVMMQDLGDTDGHYHEEPCKIGIYATCHPDGSPEGTMCTDYLPPEWINDEDYPKTPEEFYQTITANFVLVNESPGTDVDITLSSAFATVTGPGTPFEGARDYTNEVTGVVLKPGESYTITTTETLDLSERRQYGALVTAVSTMANGGICHGHDAFKFIAGINTCLNSCQNDSQCTCYNHNCSPFDNKCRNIGPALAARSKYDCRDGAGGERRCPEEDSSR